MARKAASAAADTTETKKVAEVDLGREFKVRLTLMEDMLGTAPNSRDIYHDYIESKGPDAPSTKEEIEMVGIEEYAEKQITVFRRNKLGQPIILDYLIKGFFKNACSALREVPGTKSSKLTSYKKKIDGLVFINEREIPIQMPEEAEITLCERPLRANTPQGDRVALACSESVPAGTVLEFTIYAYTKAMADLCVEWLDYGKRNGLGQWHNSGMGRFTWEDITE
jgi:hypothetical protein